MSAKKKDDDLLSSWKEIAQYLKCGERTCRRWEKEYGLPILRVGEKSRTSVYAYKDELDKWLQNRRNRTIISKEKSRWYKSPYLFLPLIFIGLFLIYFFFIRDVLIRQPSDFKIVKSTLIMLDASGKELWRYDTGIENLQSDSYYRKHFQFKKDPIIEEDGRGTLIPWIIVIDINSDQKKEILFSIVTQDKYNSGKLICFNQKGKVIWEFLGGREIKFGTETFADFVIRGFDVYDLDGDGFLEIVIISHAVHRFPTRLCVLDYKGQVSGEYWNSGQLADFCFADLNSDGRDKLVVVGLNNEYKKGCLVVLDPLKLKGCSPQQQFKYKCNELDIGSELYYILFPRTDVDYYIHEVEGTRNIKILENNLFSIRMLSSGLIYKIDYKLKLQNVVMSHTFKNLHRNLLREGEISSEINEEYERNLINGLLYWDGKNWVSTPTMTSYCTR